MINFLGRADGEPLIGVALSESDLAALIAGKAVSFSVGDLGCRLEIAGAGGTPEQPGAILLFRAEPQAVRERLTEVCGPPLEDRDVRERRFGAGRLPAHLLPRVSG